MNFSLSFFSLSLSDATNKSSLEIIQTKCWQKNEDNKWLISAKWSHLSLWSISTNKSLGSWQKTELRFHIVQQMLGRRSQIRLDTIQLNREWKDTWSLLLSSVSLRVCYFLSEDWANCFALEHNSRRPMDVCFAFIFTSNGFCVDNGEWTDHHHHHHAYSFGLKPRKVCCSDTGYIPCLGQKAILSHSFFLLLLVQLPASLSLSLKVTRCLAEKRRRRGKILIDVDWTERCSEQIAGTRTTPTRIHQYLNKYIAFEFWTKIVQI